MPMRPRISTLPAAMRAQLDRKLIAAGFGNIVAITAWLQAKGHKIGKSAVGVHALSLRAQFAADVETARKARRAPDAAALRLGCLQAAARHAGPTAAVLKRAEVYADWVQTGVVRKP